MPLPILSLLLAPAVTLLALAAVIPRSVADGISKKIRDLVTAIAMVQLIAACAATGGFVWSLLASQSAATVEGARQTSTGIASAILFDGVSCLMFLMVSFIGWVICRYSVRYLDGDDSQGNYFRWTGFTIGAVSLMVLSGNLILFYVAWLLTSLGLHQLLLHDPERPAARRAAWTKFTISRIGDLMLAIAFVMIYSELGTLNLAELFARASSIDLPSVNVQVASFLLVAAAAVKSAQFPCHVWLPQTLETPTPVSALMHAGIVNAGGYLIVRTSPIVVLTPWALYILAIVGAITACFAAIVMTTQTSVKKSLAYSTIAQMGFMMLQCGLGAFSAALLHIVAHSMYKAHAFLASGSVIATAEHRGALPHEATSAAETLKWNLTAAGLTVGGFAAALFVTGVDVSTKPGGIVLGAILCLALTHWLAQVFAAGNRSLSMRGVAIAGGMCLVYSASLSAVNQFTAQSVPPMMLPTTAWIAASSILLIGFIGLLFFDRNLVASRPAAWSRRWYVHASNGFYVESFFRSLGSTLMKT